MKIIIQLRNLRNINELINDIYTTHWKKIRRASKTAREIIVINGDEIRFITYEKKYMDGIAADVAVGPYAFHLTRYSNQEKKIWDFQDLDNYLSGI